jgi:hypothetical protein
VTEPIHFEPEPDDGRWYAPGGGYRVFFWEQMNSPDPPTAPLWSSSVRRIVGAANVIEAIEWVRSQADGRPFTLYLEVDRNPPGLVRIFGTDPTADKPDTTEVA